MWLLGGQKELTLPPFPEAQANVTSLPGLASTTRAAFCACWPHERFGFDAPLTGDTSSMRRIGLSTVPCNTCQSRADRKNQPQYAPEGLLGTLPWYV